MILLYEMYYIIIRLTTKNFTKDVRHNENPPKPNNYKTNLCILQVYH